MIELLFLFISFQKVNMVRQEQKLAAICDLIFECLKFLLSSINGHSIQRKFPRKLCNSIINIDITNISVTIFANITTYILSNLKGSDVYEKCNRQMIF